MFVGISIATNEIKSVALYDDGRLSGDKPGHLGTRTSNPDQEVGIQYGLTEVFSYAPQFGESEWVKSRYAELREKAANRAAGSE